MIGFVLLVLASLAAVAGWLLLRRSDSGWRVGRLLAAAPRRTLAQAAELAAAGEERYVRLHGRVDSDEEFLDEAGRPIVFRRRRLQERNERGAWLTFDDDREAVTFRLQDAGAQVAIDVEALGDGLVVVPRESEGVAADLASAPAADLASAPAADVSSAPTDRSRPAVTGGPALDPATPVRLRIEQISSVEHATAAGVPRIGPGGAVVLGPGLGRPLVLTTLELDEAMRVLAGDHRRELVGAAVLLSAGAVLAVAGAILLVLGV